MSEMVEIIALLEGATEGSRALDAEIAVKIGWRDDERYIDGGAKTMAFLRGHGHPPAQEEIGDRMGLPRYSTSVDAALSLIPTWEDFGAAGHWALMTPGREDGIIRGSFGAVIHHPLSSGGGPKWFGFAPTLPLALCIAALKALNPSPSAEKGR